VAQLHERFQKCKGRLVKMMKAASCWSRPWCWAKRWRKCEHVSKCGKYLLCYRWQATWMHVIISCSYFQLITKIRVAWER
jgi:hypothetical protein